MLMDFACTVSFAKLFQSRMTLAAKSSNVPIWLLEYITSKLDRLAIQLASIELYRAVDYDSKWSTKFHKDCMLDFCNFTFKTSFDI